MTFWVFLNPEASRKNICKDHKLGKENIHSLNQVITFARKLTLTHRFFLCVNKKLEEVGSRLNSRLAYLRSLPYNSSGSHSKWSHTILFTHCLGLTWDVCDGSHGTPKGTGTLKIADRPTEHPTLTGTHTIVFPPNSPETARVEITLTVRNLAWSTEPVCLKGRTSKAASPIDQADFQPPLITEPQRAKGSFREARWEGQQADQGQRPKVVPTLKVHKFKSPPGTKLLTR